jgi:DNA repair exonuclease SbcCD ATPase subunit
MAERKLSQLLLDTLDQTASKEDVANLTRQLVNFVKTAKEKLETAAEYKSKELDQKIAEIIQATQQHETRTAQRQDLDKQTMYSESRTLMRLVEQKVEEIRALIPELPDLSPYDQKIEELRSIIPSLPDELSPQAIRDKLETLEGEERLNVSAIDGLEDLLKRLEKVEKKPATMVGGGIVGRDLIKDIDLSSQLNGVTKTFQLPAIWNVVSVHLSSFPHALRKTVDFTYTPTSITFTSEIDAATSLATGQTCVLTVVSA